VFKGPPKPINDASPSASRSATPARAYQTGAGDSAIPRCSKVREKQLTPTARMSLPPSSRPIKSSKMRSRQRHESSPFAYGPLGPRLSLASATIKTSESVARRQCASDRRERNMKTYQISDDRLVVVNKNLVVIKQKDSDKSFEFTPGRLVLCMFVTKYCISRFVCIGGC